MTMSRAESIQPEVSVLNSRHSDGDGATRLHRLDMD